MEAAGGVRKGAGRGQTWFLTATIGVAALLVVWALWASWGGHGSTAASAYDSQLTLAQIPFDGTQAYSWLVRLCQLGPRISGSEGMRKQQELLAEHFRSLGGQVEFQEFQVRHPESGRPVTLRNLRVQWHPQRKERILLCTHYDTRPLPDRDPRPDRRRLPFLGANDGTSGTAVLCVLARHIVQLDGPVGVDFVLFDGEELVYNDRRDHYFLGSTHFAKQYVASPPDHRYRWAVLLDMVGDASLQIFQERYSARWEDSRPLVDSIWATAGRLGVDEFIPRRRHWVRDDHLPLHDIAGIPACDLIDFDYPYPGSRESYWHTTEDRPENCSPLSLAKVGWVLSQWLKEATGSDEP